MDCLRVQELLSENADGRPIPADDLAAARAHCDGCPECAAFERGLALLAATQAPSAPAALIDSILDIASAAAADARAFAEDRAEETRPLGHTRDLRPSRWMPRFAVFAGAAVFLVAALTITTIGFTGGLKQLASQDDSILELAADEEAGDRAAVAESEPTAADNAVTGTMAASPPYVSVNGLVYIAGAPADVDESELETIGPVDGRSSEDTDVSAYAYTTSDSEYTVLIEEAGGWMVFEPVTRRFAGTDYQLATGTPITGDGIWPDLPEAYPVPTCTSPTFRFFGYDDLGVEIYVLTSGTEQDGFAVAPYTASDDPAAGNPNWTWWIPLP